MYTSFRVGEEVVMNTPTITPILGTVIESGKTYIKVSFNGTVNRYNMHDCHFYIRKLKSEI